MKRPIFPSLSPNLEAKDFFYSLKLFLLPWSLTNGSGINALEQWFRQFFKVSHAVSFNSGRASLTVILRALNIGRGDEIILQGFTCVAVPNAIVWQGAKPIYIDIDSSFTMDTSLLLKKITRRTKAIVVQHTFGIPSKMEKIMQIAKERKIPVIEDCAHGIGYTYRGKKLGTWGDVAFFSFGRDKAFSSVFGGMIITDNEVLGKKIRAIQKRQDFPNVFWTLQQLFHPIVFFFILPLYDTFSIGTAMLFVLQRLKFLSFPVTDSEKKVDKKSLFVRKMPNSLAKLALFQLHRMSQFNLHRREIAKLYLTNIRAELIPYNKLVPFLRFPVVVENRDYVLSYLRKRKIYLGGAWYSVIDPKGTDYEAVGYKKGICPKAELLAKKVVHLPAYPTLERRQAEKVIAILKECTW